MSKKLIFLTSFVLVLALAGTNPAFGAEIDIRIANGADDVEQHLNDGRIDSGSTDLELAYELAGNPTTDEQVIGLRFVNIPLSKGAQITNAYVEFEVDKVNKEGSQAPVNLVIEGELTPDAPRFANVANNVTDRIPTTAKVKWSIPPWTAQNEKFQTPDISSIIQEIVSQDGWVSGNALVLIFRDDKDNPSTGLREAESCNGEKEAAPLLHIEFASKYATDPDPADGAESVPVDTTVSWTPGDTAATHDVYFGTSSPPALIGNQEANSYDPGSLGPGTTYYWQIDEVEADGTTKHTGDVWSFTTVPDIPIAPGWTNADVGTPTPGSASYEEATGTWTVTGNGNDIWLDSDNFHYVYKYLRGDGEIIARVASLGPGSDPWAKAGAMIRDTLHAGSPNAFVAITGGAGNGATFQGRIAADGGSGSSRTLVGISPPASVKLVRQGDTFTSYIFLDGQWQQQGQSATVAMADPVYVGLAITSHADGELRTATFDNVTLIGDIYDMQLTAYSPYPADGAEGVPVDANLSWTPGDTAATHDVYFGTSSPPAFIGNQAEISYDPGPLELSTTYYWQIDAVEADGTTIHTGDVWSFTTAATTGVKKGAYLIYPGDNTQMTVLWQLDATHDCTLEWGTDTNYGSSATSSEYGSDHQHQYTITSLATGAKYYYRVQVEAGYLTGSFVAAPAADAENVKFLAYGDCRSLPDIHDAVNAQMIAAYTADPAYQTFTMLTGDWVANGDNESHWTNQFFNRFWSNTMEMQANLPINGCIGNHERSGILFEKYWPYPYESGGQYWSFDYGPAHIVVLDQYTTSYAPGSPQYIWLQNDLANATAPWKFIQLHAPGWTTGRHANNSAVQNDIQPLCETYGVAIVFGGHNHYYARAMVEGVAHITTGGGGAPLYQPEAGHPNIVAYDQSHHFCKIDIQGKQLTFEAVRLDGTVIDTFTMSH